MARVIFPQQMQHRFIESVKSRTHFSFKTLAQICSCHQRSFSDWYHEKTNLPLHIANRLVVISGISLPLNVQVKKERWHSAVSGAKGGAVRIKRHGNPGTILGRSKGGQHSMAIQRKQSKMFLPKTIHYPKRSAFLAEFIGIILGDGGMSKYQLSVTLNASTDMHYAIWVQQLVYQLFQIHAPLIKRSNHCVVLVVSSIKVIRFLNHCGLACGSKMKWRAHIPEWIMKSPRYRRACLRGLIDTDGCVYIDKHNYKEKIYQNICVDFTNYSQPLLLQAYFLLVEFDLLPRLYKNNNSVKIRHEDAVRKYYLSVGTSNLKHAIKFIRFFGEVA